MWQKKVESTKNQLKETKFLLDKQGRLEESHSEAFQRLEQLLQNISENDELMLNKISEYMQAVYHKYIKDNEKNKNENESIDITDSDSSPSEEPEPPVHKSNKAKKFQDASDDWDEQAFLHLDVGVTNKPSNDLPSNKSNLEISTTSGLPNSNSSIPLPKIIEVKSAISLKNRNSNESIPRTKSPLGNIQLKENNGKNNASKVRTSSSKRGRDGLPMFNPRDVRTKSALRNLKNSTNKITSDVEKSNEMKKSTDNILEANTNIDEIIKDSIKKSDISSSRLNNSKLTVTGTVNSSKRTKTSVAEANECNKIQESTCVATIDGAKFNKDEALKVSTRKLLNQCKSTIAKIIDSSERNKTESTNNNSCSTLKSKIIILDEKKMATINKAKKEKIMPSSTGKNELLTKMLLPNVEVPSTMVQPSKDMLPSAEVLLSKDPPPSTTRPLLKDQSPSVAQPLLKDEPPLTTRPLLKDESTKVPRTNTELQISNLIEKEVVPTNKSNKRKKSHDNGNGTIIPASNETIKKVKTDSCIGTIPTSNETIKKVKTDSYINSNVINPLIGKIWCIKMEGDRLSTWSGFGNFNSLKRIV